VNNRAGAGRQGNRGYSQANFHRVRRSGRGAGADLGTVGELSTAGSYAPAQKAPAAGHAMLISGLARLPYDRPMLPFGSVPIPNGPFDPTPNDTAAARYWIL